VQPVGHLLGDQGGFAAGAVVDPLEEFFPGRFIGFKDFSEYFSADDV
jgi:hypothetical protein